ncbi:MAG: hypothetical protein M1299_12910 [Firmicutes bacterium]|nr:hypothetical protein [Bacillota bacterium]
MRMVDIVPTICHLLGIEPPAQSQGAVLYDLFEGHEIQRELLRGLPNREAKGWREIWTSRRYNEFVAGLRKESS